MHIKINVDNVHNLIKLSPSAMRVLFISMLFSTQDDLVDYSFYTKRRVMSLANVKYKTFSNAITELLDAQVITRVKRGLYKVSPTFITITKNNEHSFED
jgi:predicted transcriptional regulator of viral defense system